MPFGLLTGTFTAAGKLVPSPKTTLIAGGSGFIGYKLGKYKATNKMKNEPSLSKSDADQISEMFETIAKKYFNIESFKRDDEHTSMFVTELNKYNPIDKSNQNNYKIQRFQSNSAFQENISNADAGKKVVIKSRIESEKRIYNKYINSHLNKKHLKVVKHNKDAGGRAAIMAGLQSAAALVETELANLSRIPGDESRKKMLEVKKQWDAYVKDIYCSVRLNPQFRFWDSEGGGQRHDLMRLQAKTNTTFRDLMKAQQNRSLADYCNKRLNYIDEAEEAATKFFARTISAKAMAYEDELNWTEIGVDGLYGPDDIKNRLESQTSKILKEASKNAFKGHDRNLKNLISQETTRILHELHEEIDNMDVSKLKLPPGLTNSLDSGVFSSKLKSYFKSQG